MPEESSITDKTTNGTKLKDIIGSSSPININRHRKKHEESFFHLLRDSVYNFFYNKLKSPSFRNQSERLLEEKIKEQKQRRHFRWFMFICFFILLVVQYYLLYLFVKYILENNMLANAQLVLNIIIPSTLGETYIIMREMVNFVFTSGDFKSKEDDSKKPDIGKAQSIAEDDKIKNTADQTDQR